MTAAVPALARGGIGRVPLWFGADALVTGVNALGYLVLAAPLVDVLGASTTTHRSVGAVLGVFALWVGLVARVSRLDGIRTRGAKAVVAVNAAWVIGSLAVAAGGWGDYSAVGRGWLIAQAAVVGFLALMQARALRQP